MNKRTFRTLLIDNSNTFTKLLLSSDGRLSSERLVIPTAELSVERLSQMLEGVRYDRVLISSVVPAARAVFASAFSVPTVFLSAQQHLPLTFYYENLASLGEDRVANALGVALLGHFPCVAVDLGTAVTFDVVEKRGHKICFTGGLISPGLACMSQYLAYNTAQLPQVDLADSARVIGRSTQDAMRAGCVEGFCGMVQGILASVEKELGTRPYVVATGGDAALIASRSGIVDEVDPLLTFNGLNAAVPYVF